MESDPEVLDLKDDTNIENEDNEEIPVPGRKKELADLILELKEIYISKSYLRKLVIKENKYITIINKVLIYIYTKFINNTNFIEKLVI
jgi:hypothetical protein